MLMVALLNAGKILDSRDTTDGFWLEEVHGKTMIHLMEA